MNNITTWIEIYKKNFTATLFQLRNSGIMGVIKT